MSSAKGEKEKPDKVKLIKELDDILSQIAVSCISGIFCTSQCRMCVLFSMLAGGMGIVYCHSLSSVIFFC